MIEQILVQRTNHIGLVWQHLRRTAGERGWVHSGGGFGKMFRIAWYSAKQPGAHPSGQGGTTGHSDNVVKIYQGNSNLFAVVLELSKPQPKRLP